MSDTTNALSGSSGANSGLINALAHPTVVNPLAAYQGALQTAKSDYEVQQLRANKAIGDILQQSTDENGNVNYEKAGQLAAAAGPVVQSGMQTYLRNASELRGQQLEQGLARNKAASNAIIGALNGDDAGLHDRVVSGLQGLVSNGAMTQEQATRSALSLPSDPTQLRQRLQQIQTQLAPPDLQQQQIAGRMGTQTGPGGVTIGTRQDINTGAVSAPPQQGAPQGLDPAQAAEYQRWLKTPKDYPTPGDPNTTKHGTNESYLIDTGVPPKYIYPGGAPATPGTQPGQSSPLGTGRLPPALTNPNKPQVTPPAPTPATTSPPAPAAVPFGGYTIGGSQNPLTPAAPATSATTTPPPTPTPAPPQGTGISGPTPAQRAAATATEKGGELGPPQFQAEATASTKAQNQQAILGNMLSDTSQFFTGPQAGIVGKVRNLAIGLGIPGANVEAQTAKESFTKLASQLADAQGAGSDARMNVNISANPHEELSAPGVDLILRQLQGNADYIRARGTLAAKYPNKADYPGFQESIKELDPRVFQMARMTGEQRTTYWKSLDTEARKQLDAAGKKARELGVLGG